MQQDDTGLERGIPVGRIGVPSQKSSHWVWNLNNKFGFYHGENISSSGGKKTEQKAQV
jgi:hypothetical protein